jgi:hypothetical protein
MKERSTAPDKISAVLHRDQFTHMEVKFACPFKVLLSIHFYNRLSSPFNTGDLSGIEEGKIVDILKAMVWNDTVLDT